MEVKVELDKRCEEDKRFDRLFDKMVRDANLNPRQKYIVRRYLISVIGEKVREVEDAMDIGFTIGLIELFNFGHNKKATRLPRLKKYVRDVVNEAYGKDAVDANGCLHYDGCGLEHLKMRLARHGVEFVDK